ncbi:hypothetical protein INT47_002241, partial [Mucor saturninus]
PPRTSFGRPPSDLVKLGQQMKVMLNNLVIHRVDASTVCDTLVEAEISLIPNMFLSLNNLKVILKTFAVDTAKKIEQNELVRAKGKANFRRSRLPLSWVHENTCKFSMV